MKKNNKNVIYKCSFAIQYYVAPTITAYHTTNQLFISRKKLQASGFSWFPSSRWNSDTSTSLSWVPIERNCCISCPSMSLSTSISPQLCGWAKETKIRVKSSQWFCSTHFAYNLVHLMNSIENEPLVSPITLSFYSHDQHVRRRRSGNPATNVTGNDTGRFHYTEKRQLRLTLLALFSKIRE